MGSSAKPTQNWHEYNLYYTACCAFFRIYRTVSFKNVQYTRYQVHLNKPEEKCHNLSGKCSQCFKWTKLYFIIPIIGLITTLFSNRSELWKSLFIPLIAFWLVTHRYRICNCIFLSSEKREVCECGWIMQSCPASDWGTTSYRITFSS